MSTYIRWREAGANYFFTVVTYQRRRLFDHPTARGLLKQATKPQNWPWSSIHRHVRLGWLDPAWPAEKPLAIPDLPGE